MMSLNLLVKIKIIDTSQLYVWWLMAVQLSIFTMLLYLSGISAWQGFVMELCYILIAFYINADVFKGEYSRSDIVSILQEFEKEIFIISLVLFVRARTGLFNRLLLFGHVITYGISVFPLVNYAGIILQNWIIQSFLAIFYNIWWIAFAIIYYTPFYQRRFYVKA